MKITHYLRAITTVCLILLSGLAHALSYCPKPNGVATREIAFEQLSGFRELIESRLSKDKKYLIIAKVPGSVQQEQRFIELEEKSLIEQKAKDPEIIAMGAVFAKELGLTISKEEAAKLFLKELSKRSKRKDNHDIGLVYLYSNSEKLLKNFDSNIATKTGLVIEGSPEEVNLLLGATKDSGQDFDWWRKNIPRDVEVVITVGFAPSPEIRDLVKRETLLLRVADWGTVNSEGLIKLKTVLDVEPHDAAVLNLFPLNAEEVSKWNMDASRGEMYVTHGIKLQSDHERLGYTVHHPINIKSKEDVINWIQDQATARKKILVLAESTIDNEGNYFMRLPGLADGISANDLSRLDDKVLSRLFVVSCNSQSLSQKTPLAIIGTIYTDSAAKLIRTTFAAPQVDSLGDYLQSSSGLTKTWLEPVARIANNLVAPSQDNVVIDGQFKFRPVAQVIQFSHNPIITTATSPQALSTTPSTDLTGINNESQQQALKLFAIGIFGAASREGLRWKRIIARRKGRVYARASYFILSALLMVAAGGVAYLFAQLMPSSSLAIVVAFVAGVGFEKIVKLAAELKIWNPIKAVPMGPEAAQDSAEHDTSDTLTFLRHGE